MADQAEEDNFGLKFANQENNSLRTLQFKKSRDGVRKDEDKLAGVDDGLGIKRQPSQDSDAIYGISKEIYNFSSAPQNADSAFQGN